VIAEFVAKEVGLRISQGKRNWQQVFLLHKYCVTVLA